METRCTCQCGASSVEVKGEPITRLICHCLVCQSIYKRPYADVTVWWKRAVLLPSSHNFRFARYCPPPALQRGTCATCGLPVVGLLRMAPYATLAFVPTMNFPDSSVLPPPFAHIFYHRRQQAIDDDLPKISGHWRSRLAVTKAVLTAVLGISRRNSTSKSDGIGQ